MTNLLFARFRQLFSWKRQHFCPLLMNGPEQRNTHSSIWLPSVPPSWFDEEPRSTHNTYIKRIIHILEPFSWGRDRATEIPTVRAENTFHIGSIPPCVQLPYQPTRHLCLYYLSSISNTFEKHNSQLPNLWGNICIHNQIVLYPTVTPSLIQFVGVITVTSEYPRRPVGSMTKPVSKSLCLYYILHCTMLL